MNAIHEQIAVIMVPMQLTHNCDAGEHRKRKPRPSYRWNLSDPSFDPYWHVDKKREMVMIVRGIWLTSNKLGGG